MAVTEIEVVSDSGQALAHVAADQLFRVIVRTPRPLGPGGPPATIDVTFNSAAGTRTLRLEWDGGVGDPAVYRSTPITLRAGAEGGGKIAWWTKLGWLPGKLFGRGKIGFEVSTGGTGAIPYTEGGTVTISVGDASAQITTWDSSYTMVIAQTDAILNVLETYYQQVLLTLHLVPAALQKEMEDLARRQIRLIAEARTQIHDVREFAWTRAALAVHYLEVLGDPDQIVWNASTHAYSVKNLISEGQTKGLSVFTRGMVNVAIGMYQFTVSQTLAGDLYTLGGTTIMGTKATGMDKFLAAVSLGTQSSLIAAGLKFQADTRVARTQPTGGRLQAVVDGEGRAIGVERAATVQPTTGGRGGLTMRAALDEHGRAVGIDVDVPFDERAALAGGRPGLKAKLDADGNAVGLQRTPIEKAPAGTFIADLQELGFLPEEAAAINRVIDKHAAENPSLGGIRLQFRPAGREAAVRRSAGAPGKDEKIKVKTVDADDVAARHAHADDLGIAILLNPDKLPFRLPKKPPPGIDKARWDQILGREQQRVDEYGNEHTDLDHLVEAGLVRIDEQGRVIDTGLSNFKVVDGELVPVADELFKVGGTNQFYVADLDAFAFLDAKGNRLSAELATRIVEDLRKAGIKHGAIVDWSPTKDKDIGIKAKILSKHQGTVDPATGQVVPADPKAGGLVELGGRSKPRQIAYDTPEKPAAASGGPAGSGSAPPGQAASSTPARPPPAVVPPAGAHLQPPAPPPTPPQPPSPPPGAPGGGGHWVDPPPMPADPLTGHVPPPMTSHWVDETGRHWSAPPGQGGHLLADPHGAGGQTPGPPTPAVPEGPPRGYDPQQPLESPPPMGLGGYKPLTAPVPGPSRGYDPHQLLESPPPMGLGGDRPFDHTSGGPPPVPHAERGNRVALVGAIAGVAVVALGAGALLLSGGSETTNNSKLATRVISPASVPPGTAPDNPIATAAPVTVEVAVVDERTRRPISGAQIDIDTPTGLHGALVTNASGKVQFVVRTIGRYRVVQAPPSPFSPVTDGPAVFDLTIKDRNVAVQFVDRRPASTPPPPPAPRKPPPPPRAEPTAPTVTPTTPATEPSITSPTASPPLPSTTQPLG